MRELRGYVAGGGGRRLLAALVALSAAAPTARLLCAETPLAPLVERLSAADASARAEAACELGRRGAAAAPAVGALAALLPDALPVGPVECGMSPWLRRTLEARPEQWRRFETSPGREAARALARIGRPALEPLLAALRAPSPQARGHAAFGIGELAPREGRAEALGRLSLAVKDEDAFVREASIRALGKLDDKQAVPVLLATLRDKATPVRAAAAWALGELEDPRATEPLMRTLWDAEAEVRAQAAWALGEIGDASAAGPLAMALKDASPTVRKQAAWALGEMKGLER